MNRLDISTKILQWVQGVKIIAPVVLALVVGTFKYSPRLWATKAWNPWTLEENWDKANKAKAEANGFTDIELGVFGAEMASGKLLKLGVRMDDMDFQIASNKVDTDNMMRDIIYRLEEMERGRSGYQDSNARQRGGLHQGPRSSSRHDGAQYHREYTKDM